MKNNQKEENKFLAFIKRILKKESDVKMLSEKNEIHEEFQKEKDLKIEYAVPKYSPRTYEEVVAGIKVGTLKLNEISREELLNIEKICMKALAKKEEKVRIQMEKYRKQNAIN